MVGYAAERLQADDVADALPGQCGDLSGNQPSLAELLSEIALRASFALSKMLSNGMK